MQIITLPPTLPHHLGIQTINHQLLIGEATLDWSQVQDAPVPRVAELLAGLDLVEHGERLGLDTIPDQLAPTILHVLSGQKGKPGQKQHHVPDIKQGVTPALWKDDEPTVQETGGSFHTDGERPQGIASPPPEKASRPLLQPPSPSALRDELERLVLQDLLGPAAGVEEEVDEGSVHDRYLVGMLAPRGQQMQPEELDELAIPEEGSVEDGANDDTALQMATFYPSSIGLSFCVEGQATSLSVKAAWGYYKREHSETLKTPKGSPKLVWKRQQMGGNAKLLALKEGAIATWSPELEEQPDVVVRGLVRRQDDSWTVTLFLVNEQREPEKRRDEAWVFQPELTVEAPDGTPIFQQRTPARRRPRSDEEQAMTMLYRRAVSFAIGHGVSVHAETVAGDSTRAFRLTTRVMPSYEVPRTEAPTSVEIPGLAHLVLDMKELAQCPATELAGKLTPLVTAYR
jgi:hypothetical protein